MVREMVLGDELELVLERVDFRTRHRIDPVVVVSKGG